MVDSPAFRAPKPPRPTPSRRAASRRYLTEAEYQDRVAYLDAIGRRCIGWDYKCTSAANAQVTAQKLDVDGNPVGQPITIQGCFRHRRLYQFSPQMYRPLEVVEFPPLPELKTKADRDAYVRSLQHKDA